MTSTLTEAELANSQGQPGIWPIRDFLRLGQDPSSPTDLLISLTQWLATSLRTKTERQEVVSQDRPVTWAPEALKRQLVEFHGLDVTESSTIEGPFHGLVEGAWGTYYVTITTKDGLVRIDRESGHIATVNQVRWGGNVEEAS